MPGFKLCVGKLSAGQEFANRANRKGQTSRATLSRHEAGTWEASRFEAIMHTIVISFEELEASKLPHQGNRRLVR